MEAVKDKSQELLTTELVRHWRDKFAAMKNFEDLKEIREGFRDAYGLTDMEALPLLRSNVVNKILALLEEINKNRGNNGADKEV